LTHKKGATLRLSLISYKKGRYILSQKVNICKHLMMTPFYEIRAPRADRIPTVERQ